MILTGMVFVAKFEFEHLRLAFAYHMVEQIVHADDAVEFKETGFMERHFPVSQLLKYGFIEESGDLTQRFSDALVQALLVLPQELSLEQKLQFINTFIDASMVDNQMQQEEGNVLLTAARLLAIPLDIFQAHLQTMASEDNFELPPPE